MGKGTKSIAFYLMMILIFGSLMYFIVKEGESQQVGTAVQTMQNAPQTMGDIKRFVGLLEIKSHDDLHQ